MSFEESRQGDVVVLKYTGELDASTLPEFSERINRLVDEGESHFVLDLPGLTFMVSAGFGYLLRVRKTLHEREGGIVLSRPGAFVKKLIATFGMADAFPMYDSVDAAVRHFDA